MKDSGTNLLIYMTTSLSVSLSYIIMFGLSGRGLIFIYAFQLLCYTTYISTTVTGLQRLAVWWLVGFHGLLVFNQLEYMKTLRYSDDFMLFFYIVMLVLLLFMLAGIFRGVYSMYRLQGADIASLEPNRFYLVIKRPKTFRDIFKCLLGDRKHSISLSLGYDWLLFKDDKIGLKGSSEDFYGYSFLDTNITASPYQREMFWSLVGTPYTVSDNCITVWEKVLDGTKFEHNPFEVFPTTYLDRVLKYTGDSK